MVLKYIFIVQDNVSVSYMYHLRVYELNFTFKFIMDFI